MGGGGVLYLIIYSIVENVPRGTYYLVVGSGDNHIPPPPDQRFNTIHFPPTPSALRITIIPQPSQSTFTIYHYNPTPSSSSIIL